MQTYNLANGNFIAWLIVVAVVWLIWEVARRVFKGGADLVSGKLKPLTSPVSQQDDPSRGVLAPSRDLPPNSFQDKIGSRCPLHGGEYVGVTIFELKRPREMGAFALSQQLVAETSLGKLHIIGCHQCLNEARKYRMMIWSRDNAADHPVWAAAQLYPHLLSDTFAEVVTPAAPLPESSATPAETAVPVQAPAWAQQAKARFAALGEPLMYCFPDILERALRSAICGTNTIGGGVRDRGGYGAYICPDDVLFLFDDPADGFIVTSRVIVSPKLYVRFRNLRSIETTPRGDEVWINKKQLGHFKKAGNPPQLTSALVAVLEDSMKAASTQEVTLNEWIKFVEEDMFDLRRSSNSLDRSHIFVAPNIPANILGVAITSVCPAENDTDVLAVYEKATPPGCFAGLILARNFVAWRDDPKKYAPVVVRYADLTDISSTDDGKALMLNGKTVRCYQGFVEFSRKKELTQLLVQLLESRRTLSTHGLNKEQSLR